jgi:hypothetical protein
MSPVLLYDGECVCEGNSILGRVSVVLYVGFVVLGCLCGEVVWYSRRRYQSSLVNMLVIQASILRFSTTDLVTWDPWCYRHEAANGGKLFIL